MRALLVDDDPFGLEALGVLLVDDGWQIALAGTASEAMAQAAVAPPDLVITDLRLPDLDGASLARRLLALAPPPVVVALSGDLRGQARGPFAALLEKPCGPAALRAALRDALRARPVPEERG